VKNYSKNIEEFLTFLRTCEQDYHMAEANEQEANSVTQDLLHSIELEEHTYHDYAKCSKELRDVRKLRRVAKDTISQIAPILDWVEQNRSTIKKLEQILGMVRKMERSTESRIYTPRVRKQEGEQRNDTRKNNRQSGKSGGG